MNLSEIRLTLTMLRIINILSMVNGNRFCVAIGREYADSTDATRKCMLLYKLFEVQPIHLTLCRNFWMPITVPELRTISVDLGEELQCRGVTIAEILVEPGEGGLYHCCMQRTMVQNQFSFLVCRHLERLSLLVCLRKWRVVSVTPLSPTIYWQIKSYTY